MHYRRVECNDRVNRLTKSDYGKSTSLRTLKKSWKGLRNGFSIYIMDKVDQFRVTGNCISDKLSIIKAGSMYPCRDTILSKGSNTLPEEQRITESLDNQKYIA